MSKMVFTVMLLSLLLNTHAMADPVSTKLVINGQVVEGESSNTSQGRMNTIEALSASISGSNTSNSGKGEYAPFTILKRVDVATPKLVRAMAMGEQVDRLEASYYKPSPAGDGTTVLYYTIVLENGHVNSYTW